MSRRSDEEKVRFLFYVEDREVLRSLLEPVVDLDHVSVAILFGVEGGVLEVMPAAKEAEATEIVDALASLWAEQRALVRTYEHCEGSLVTWFGDCGCRTVLAVRGAVMDAEDRARAASAAQGIARTLVDIAWKTMTEDRLRGIPEDMDIVLEDLFEPGP